jgi:hypothetical protein
MKERLLLRVQELGKAVNESLENHQRIKVALDNATSSHNALVGRLDEANYQYQEWEKSEKKEPIKGK